MPQRETPTVSAAIHQWLDTRSTLAANTVMNDRSVLNCFAKHVGTDRHIRYLSPANVESYFRSIRHHKPASYNKARSRIAQFLDYAQRHGWVQVNLLVDVGKMRVPNVERFRLAPSELVGLLEIPQDPRDRGFLAVAMNTGLRASEITGLRVKDVDFEDGELYIMRWKSQADDRLGMTPMLDTELRQWLRHYAQSLKVPLDGAMWLFRARTSPRGMTPHGEPVLGHLKPHTRLTHTEPSDRPSDRVKTFLRADVDARESECALNDPAHGGRCWYAATVRAAILSG